MEEPSPKEKYENIIGINDSKISEQCITTNWILAQDNKRLSDVISTISGSKASKNLTLEEIATEDSCVILQPANANVDSEREACTVDINLMGQKISRIGVVSEASVLEFFKESGEYAGTEFAELIDEFEGATVYFAQLNFQRPTSQASVKFTRINNNSRTNMYLYGMKLVIEKDENSSPNERPMFEDILKNSYGENIAPGIKTGMTDFTSITDYDGNFATEMDACLRSFMDKAWAPRGENPRKKQFASVPTVEPTNQNHIVETEQNAPTNIETYIDKKIGDMEKRLMQRIDEAEAKTIEKLDLIIKHLELRGNTS